MGRSSRRKRDRRGKAGDAPKWFTRILDQATRLFPELGRWLPSALSSLLSPAYREVWSTTTPAGRSGLLLAWRNALDSLAARKPCDLCQRPSKSVRFVSAVSAEDFRRAGMQPPGPELGFNAFALACESCGRMGSEEFLRRLIGELGPLTDARGKPRGLRPVMIGRRIGEAAPLPAHAGLEECDSCGAALWIDRDRQEATMGGELPMYLCGTCSENKPLDAVPAVLIIQPASGAL